MLFPSCHLFPLSTGYKIQPLNMIHERIQMVSVQLSSLISYHVLFSNFSAVVQDSHNSRILYSLCRNFTPSLPFNSSFFVESSLDHLLPLPAQQFCIPTALSQNLYTLVIIVHSLTYLPVSYKFFKGGICLVCLLKPQSLNLSILSWVND